MVVVWKETTRGIDGFSLGSASAVSALVSSVRTSGVTAPAFAAADSLRVTAARLAFNALIISGMAACSWAYIGRASEARAIRSMVALSRAAFAEAAEAGATLWIKAFSCSLDWLYSSGMPIMWPYSWA